ncbi:MAG TPA: PHP-associated domain-containing protein [Terriglobia bacterium]|nr:PHP-associated domain-containing protein [Terriglobia bacterium]
MRCDLHVHTIHSGMCTVPLLKHVCRESYSQPEAVYQRLKALGMDLVTVTDHDSIDAAESLRRYPDFFLSEEVTCTMPSGTEAHIGVYDITERQHLEMQRRRTDLPSLLAYLREQELLFSLNHAFSSLTGRRDASDWPWFHSAFPVLEVRNGHMLPQINSLAWEFAVAGGKGKLAGSDAHTISSLGAAYTEVPGARNRQEFLQGLRAKRTRVSGTHGGCCKLAADLLRIGFQMIREKPLTALLLPLAAVVPAVVLGHYLSELGFARRWRRWAAALESNRAPSVQPVGSEGYAL